MGARGQNKEFEMKRSIIGNLPTGTALIGLRGHRLTIMFRGDVQYDVLQITLVAFGGQDWESLGAERKDAAF